MYLINSNEMQKNCVPHTAAIMDRSKFSSMLMSALKISGNGGKLLDIYREARRSNIKVSVHELGLLAQYLYFKEKNKSHQILHVLRENRLDILKNQSMLITQPIGHIYLDCCIKSNCMEEASFVYQSIMDQLLGIEESLERDSRLSSLLEHERSSSSSSSLERDSRSSSSSSLSPSPSPSSSSSSSSSFTSHTVRVLTKNERLIEALLLYHRKLNDFEGFKKILFWLVQQRLPLKTFYINNLLGFVDGLDERIEILSHCKDLNVPPNIRTINMILESCVKARSFTAVPQIIQIYQEIGLIPNDYTLMLLMDCCRYSGDIKGAEVIFFEWRHLYNIPLTSHLVSRLLEIYIDRKEFLKAQIMFVKLMEKYPDCMDLVNINVLLKSLFFQGHHGRILNIWRDVLDSQIKSPDILRYVSISILAAASPPYDKVLDFLISVMKNNQQHLNGYTIHCIIMYLNNELALPGPLIFSFLHSCLSDLKVYEWTLNHTALMMLQAVGLECRSDWSIPIPVLQFLLQSIQLKYQRRVDMAVSFLLLTLRNGGDANLELKSEFSMSILRHVATLSDFPAVNFLQSLSKASLLDLWDNQLSRFQNPSVLFVLFAARDIYSVCVFLLEMEFNPSSIFVQELVNYLKLKNRSDLAMSLQVFIHASGNKSSILKRRSVQVE